MVITVRTVLEFLARVTTHCGTAVDRDTAYSRSYRGIRLALGGLGVALPLIFIAAESGLAGDVHLRGSISAYYHSPMQDVFVGGLCVIGFLLATYMSGEPRSLDFRASLIAGVAVLGVVFFPTSRPELGIGQPPCESDPKVPSCSFVERALGESTTAVVHAVCAIVFILGLAVMSLLFAAAELTPEGAVRRKGRFVLHTVCACVIVLAGFWALTGSDLGPLRPVYLGEVAAVWAFGASWIAAGLNVTAPHRDAGSPNDRLGAGLAT